MNTLDRINVSGVVGAIIGGAIMIFQNHIGNEPLNLIWLFKLPLLTIFGFVLAFLVTTLFSDIIHYLFFTAPPKKYVAISQLNNTLYSVDIKGFTGGSMSDVEIINAVKNTYPERFI